MATLIEDVARLKELDFREGDSKELDIMAVFFELPREGMTTESYQKWLGWATILHRMANMARKMEAKQ